MKIIFLGSSGFALESLRSLLKGHSLLAVVTQPDRKKGRHLLLSRTPVKAFAEENNLPVIATENVMEEKTKIRLRNLNADLFVVVSFGQILSKEILEIPKLYCVNLHASLLPRWRGAAPINWAIMSNDQESGVTIIKMNEYMDRGEIILAKKIPIAENDDALSLTEKLSKLGAVSLEEAIDLIEKGKASFTPQDNRLVSLAPKLKKTDGFVNWQDKAEHIHNKARGFLPWPCAYTYYQGKFLKILQTKVLEDGGQKTSGIPGEIISIERNKGIIVATREKFLAIEKLQLEGKRAMSSYEFIPGHHLKAGEILGEKKS